MRAVFIGASEFTVMAVRMLLKRGHDAVIIDLNREHIEALADELDCGFIVGDGSKPAILKEANPNGSDVLLCLTDDDRVNILASLVGRSLGFRRIVTKIEDPELEHICIELGLEGTIIPARTTGRLLADMVEGHDPMALSTMIREEATVFSFVLREASSTAGLKLPEKTRVICFYRNERFLIPGDDDRLKPGDEIYIITHRDNIPELSERWLGTQNHA